MMRNRTSCSVYMFSIAAILLLAFTTLSPVEASCTMLGKQWSARHTTTTTPSSFSPSSSSSSLDYKQICTRRTNHHHHYGNVWNNNDTTSHNARKTSTTKQKWNLYAAAARTKKATIEEVPSPKIAQEKNNEPSLAEMREQLGPIGRAIAGAVEVGVVTGGSYLSGGILGYLLGGVMGTPTLLKSSSAAASETIKNSLGEEVKGRLGTWHFKAATQAKSWAQLSAAFSGFHALTRNLRGGKEDKWNSVFGSAATGAYLSRKGMFVFLFHLFLFVCLFVLRGGVCISICSLVYTWIVADGIFIECVSHSQSIDVSFPNVWYYFLYIRIIRHFVLIQTHTRTHTHTQLDQVPCCKEQSHMQVLPMY
mmetsp:Transcript_21999/g.32686  ORF Transcript_21999/g.32686 Transcript_21999/m.32686 type:complete len:364 (-) Transcript_21999:294-1385(-)